MDGTAPNNPVVVWRPQKGPQRALLSCPVEEVFFGGARGGGKTDGMLGEWACHAGRYGKDAIGVFFRRELVQLDEAIERSKMIYGPIGANFNDQKKQWVFPNGARLKFRYLDRDADAENYQGHSYTRVYFEELTNFPDPKPVLKMKATLRSGNSTIPCRLRATGNPGGPGHQWVKARYIDPAPQGYKPLKETVHIKINGEEREIETTRVFIPSFLFQNKYLGDEYVAKLATSGSEQLVRAWLEGDWNVIDGAYFDCWRTDKHIVRPQELPEHWFRFRSFDWGSARPFACHWWAVSDGTLPQFSKGALICYREWYGADGPNVGLKMRVEDVAFGIKEREINEPIPEGGFRGVADPAIFAEDGGPSIAERFAGAKVLWKRADNKRIPGWQQVRDRLIGEDDKPMLYVFSTCVDLIRTLPALQHDENKPEDVDTDGEDHAADSVRYACMSRPYIKPKPKVEPMRGLPEMTLNELWEKSKVKTSGRI